MALQKTVDMEGAGVTLPNAYLRIVDWHGGADRPVEVLVSAYKDSDVRHSEGGRPAFTKRYSVTLAGTETGTILGVLYSALKAEGGPLAGAADV